MSVVRIGVGRIWQENNSFSSLATNPGDYISNGGIAVGPEVLNQPSRCDEVTGFLEVLGPDRQIEVVGLLNAGALPSGLATTETVSFLEDRLREQLRQSGPLDGVCFALHGANSALSVSDLDGYFLRILREELGPEIPIICTLDLHAIVTLQMLNLCNAFFAYRTHPHVDLADTGKRAAKALVDTLRGKSKPVVSYQRIPLLIPPPDAGTRDGVLKELFDTFIMWDLIDGVIGCSLCCSYAWQDVAEQGWMALAVTDDAPALGNQLVQQLAEQAWAARERLLPAPMFSPEDAVRQAAAFPGFPIVITDSADTIGAGSPGDTTDLLQSAMNLRHEVDGLILLHIPDPQAVATIKALGNPDNLVIPVGGKCDKHFSRPPVTVRGRVICITDGPISDDGKFGSEPFIDVGTIALLAVDNIRLVLTERRINGPQPSLFRKVGLEPFEAKIVILKTGVGFKATYGHVAKAVFRADCPGAASYNLNNYKYNHVPRPIFPLDGNIQWQPRLPTSMM